jgi:hypothetical protein
MSIILEIRNARGIDQPPHVRIAEMMILPVNRY